MTPEIITVEDLLKRGSGRLRHAGVETARLDARILLGHILGRAPSSLLPGDNSAVIEADQCLFDALIARREALEPVSRIIGRREFFGREFIVSPAVLDPRPDSECVVELALEVAPSASQVLDLGTGSGCLLLTILAECTDARGIGVDRSAEAIETACRNADLLGCADRVRFMESDWLGAVEGRFDLIVSNPPYIPAADIQSLMPDVRLYDPIMALDGGDDGLHAYRAILADAPGYLKQGGHVVVEVGFDQADAVSGIAAASGFEQSACKADLGGHVRGLAFTFPS